MARHNMDSLYRRLVLRHNRPLVVRRGRRHSRPKSRPHQCCLAVPQADARELRVQNELLKGMTLDLLFHPCL